MAVGRLFGSDPTSRPSRWPSPLSTRSKAQCSRRSAHCPPPPSHAGSPWHAAGLLPLFNMSYTVGQLHKYSVDLYKRLPAETGQDVSFHVTGNLRLATNRDRMDEYQKYCGTANTIGVPFEVITPVQVKEIWPLVDLGGSADTPAILGALYHPDHGHIAPADLTMALRIGARKAGAGIYEQ